MDDGVTGPPPGRWPVDPVPGGGVRRAVVGQVVDGVDDVDMGAVTATTGAGLVVEETAADIDERIVVSLRHCPGFIAVVGTGGDPQGGLDRFTVFGVE